MNTTEIGHNFGVAQNLRVSPWILLLRLATESLGGKWDIVPRITEESSPLVLWLCFSGFRVRVPVDCSICVVNSVVDRNGRSCLSSWPVAARASLAQLGFSKIPEPALGGLSQGLLVF
jgi:hypothetical protein